VGDRHGRQSAPPVRFIAPSAPAPPTLFPPPIS